ncbi:hypothetical protein [Caulobacter zeae]|uniref:hypothetical protein n=1 Tax=Caulobacter zeae TaxID=2055137 RepID=UPI00196BA262|nr:hypothetical protein [Caulobacter zeae]
MNRASPDFGDDDRPVSGGEGQPPVARRQVGRDGQKFSVPQKVQALGVPGSVAGAVDGTTRDDVVRPVEVKLPEQAPRIVVTPTPDTVTVPGADIVTLHGKPLGVTNHPHCQSPAENDPPVITADVPLGATIARSWTTQATSTV